VLALPYTALDFLSVDPDDFELLRIDCAKPPRIIELRKGDEGVEYSPQICLRCVERRRIVDEMIVAIKTDYMFQSWEVHMDAIERKDKVHWSRKGLQSKLMADLHALSASSEKETLQSYFFYRPVDYVQSDVERRGSHKVHLESKENHGRDRSTGASLQVFVVDPTGEKSVSVQVSSFFPFPLLFFLWCAALVRISNCQPALFHLLKHQVLCERFMRDMCSASLDWRVLSRPTPYLKKMNLTGDPAAWSCFEMRVRTFKGIKGGSKTEVLFSLVGKKKAKEGKSLYVQELTK